MKTFPISAVLAVSFIFASAAQAQRLDPPYNLTGKHPRPSFRTSATTPRKSPTLRVVSYQSPVKSQGSRGTCSMFAATALLESMIAMKTKAPATSIDFSEEWLEYVITRNKTTDGGNSDTNFGAILRYGMPAEAVYPYIGETWDSVSFSKLAQERCGDIPANLVKSCLIAHRDPRLLAATDAQLQSGELRDDEFLQARRAATAMKAKLLTNAEQSFWLYSEDQVKALLSRGIPLTLDLDFFYGAWNHRKADSVCENGVCIGRDMENWDRGVVGYPEPGSLDRYLSMKNRAGHAVVVVGFDDTVEVTTKQKVLEKGKYVERNFTYKGVYYIKNSWGTEALGRLFRLDARPLPGYAMITQKYANEFGAFFQLPIR